MSTVDNSNQPSTNNESKPSPESRLGDYFEHAVTQTLENFLLSLKNPLFKANFPEIYKECKTEVIALSKSLKNQLKTSITSDLKLLSSETKLFSSLKSLDDMMTKQKERADSDSWRPSGIPETDFRDHIYCLKQEFRKDLEFALKTSLVENDRLETIVEQNHAEILELRKEIHNDNQEVQSNLASANAVDFRELYEDIGTMFRKN